VPHLEEIARLRNEKPQPKSYKQIAAILLQKYKIKISPNSIWSFVRARSIGRQRRAKYTIDENLIPHDLPSPATSPTEDVDAKKEEGPESYEQRLEEIKNKPKPKMKTYND